MSTSPDKPDKNGDKQKTENRTHYELLEARYGETDWFDSLVQNPELPIESALWSASFNGSEIVEFISLPYELAHIWVYLLEIGVVAPGAMGAVTISYQEIHAWMLATGTILSPWEVVLLRKCSSEWIHAQYEAKDPNSIPPWTMDKTDHDAVESRRKAVTDRLKNALAGSVKKTKKVKS